jgi:hypothetical protein
MNASIDGRRFLLMQVVQNSSPFNIKRLKKWSQNFDEFAGTLAM